MTETKRAFNKVIRNTMMEFTFENGQVTNITYTGCPINKGWTADNLLDVNTIKSNSYEKWGYTPAQFQQKVLSQIASIEPIITEEARKKMSENASKPNLGKHLSEETRKKISEANKGREGCWKGKHHSKETIEKLSGRKWFNNGEKNIFSYSCPEGFVLGQLRHKKPCLC